MRRGGNPPMSITRTVPEASWALTAVGPRLVTVVGLAIEDDASIKEFDVVRSLNDWARLPGSAG
jgi:hypothetical protein